MDCHRELTAYFTVQEGKGKNCQLLQIFHARISPFSSVNRCKKIRIPYPVKSTNRLSYSVQLVSLALYPWAYPSPTLFTLPISIASSCLV
jgi:hypothetical protein